jgi:hypothetical protein
MDLLAQTRALRDRSRRLTVAFLSADLDYGYTLCQLVKRSPERLTERLHAAHIALDTAINFIWKANLKPSEIAELTAKVERLRLELKSAESVPNKRTKSNQIEAVLTSNQFSR